MNQLFVYKKQLPHTPHARGSCETLIIDGPRSFVDSFITRQEFADLFGGFLITQDPDDPPGVNQYRGVWGQDKVRKFKQLLKERGALFEISKIDESRRCITLTAKE